MLIPPSVVRYRSTAPNTGLELAYHDENQSSMKSKMVGTLGLGIYYDWVQNGLSLLV